MGQIEENLGRMKAVLKFDHRFDQQFFLELLKGETSLFDGNFKKIDRFTRNRDVVCCAPHVKMV